MGLRENVQTLLTQRGWSQRELAAAAGVSPGAVGGLLDGRSSNLRTAMKIAGAFSISLADLVREESPKPPREELELALRHQGGLTASDIGAVYAFISYIRDARLRGGRRAR